MLCVKTDMRNKLLKMGKYRRICGDIITPWRLFNVFENNIQDREVMKLMAFYTFKRLNRKKQNTNVQNNTKLKHMLSYSSKAPGIF